MKIVVQPNDPPESSVSNSKSGFFSENAIRFSNLQISKVIDSITSENLQFKFGYFKKDSKGRLWV